MFTKAKYIVNYGDTPVVFPETMTHADVAFALFGGKEKITGAGFVIVAEDGEYRCYGESVSLKIKSGVNDSRILNRYLGGKEYDL